MEDKRQKLDENVRQAYKDPRQNNRMKNQSEEESKKVVQRKQNEKSERKQQRVIGKLAGRRGVGGVRKARKNWGKKETRRKEGGEQGKQAIV